ncbi:DUF2169 family type VI secretion system accessory protein [Chondromyces crocatus]|uniref:DUF2169 domain-containing protein n=1 Tax=Chondromyces crocatus TaxID=52 RepID=A0A0K1EBE6_CHOCO|nr:DUF2169 domain-containing protein [Chondromyces crocatus]AKT38169.1 uncharacterized protein CMC5_023120 [Chondromyces crocatus]
MSFRRVDNTTPMAVHAEVLEGRRGGLVLTAIAKLTWEVSPTGEAKLAEPPVGVRLEDVFHGAPYASSVRFPSDRVPEKPGTDVLLVGTARPPVGGQVTAIEVGVRVETKQGALQKRARVHGPRVYCATATGIEPGPAGRLEATPLIYEHSYGGVDRSGPGRPLIEGRNPLGRGVARDRRGLVGTEAPAIEELEPSLGSRTPAPAGFGPIPAHWDPRALFGGTHDHAWKRERAPLPPVDRDPRFYACAPPGLWSAVPLLGDEPVEIVGATPGGLWRFRLPRFSPVFSCVVRGATSACPTHLDTFLIDADEGRVELTFRASIPVPRKVQAIERVIVEGHWPSPRGFVAKDGGLGGAGSRALGAAGMGAAGMGAVGRGEAG